jgi:hypothetical protein
MLQNVRFTSGVLTLVVHAILLRGLPCIQRIGSASPAAFFVWMARSYPASA